MSRFDDLNAAYKKCVADFETYQAKSKGYADFLINGFAAYLGIQRTEINHLSINNDVPHSSPTSAMELEDDTYWHWRIRLTLAVPPMPFPKIYYRLRLKADGDAILVGVGDEDKKHRINPLVKTDMEQFYEYLYQMGIDGLSNGLQRFLTESGGEKIGFDVTRRKMGEL